MRRLKHIASPSFLSSFLLFHSSGPSFLSFQSYCPWNGCGDKCPWSHSTIKFEVVSLSYILKKIATLGWLPTSASSIFFSFFCSPEILQLTHQYILPAKLQFEEFPRFYLLLSASIPSLFQLINVA